VYLFFCPAGAHFSLSLVWRGCASFRATTTKGGLPQNCVTSAHARRLSTTCPSPAPRKSRAPGDSPAISTNHRRSLAFYGCSKPELTLWCLETVHRPLTSRLRQPFLGFGSWEPGSLAIRGSCTVYAQRLVSEHQGESGSAPGHEFARQVPCPNSQESGSDHRLAARHTRVTVERGSTKKPHTRAYIVT
jgi:hypothetical protein